MQESEKPTRLAIELAGEETLEVSLPVRVEAEPAAPEQPAALVPVPETAAPQRGLAEVTEEVQAAIAALRPGIELPSRLFTALGAILRIRKGALLLYDALRLVFAPWAQRGFDQTTRHRMRIPLGANEAWNALANGSPILLSGAPALSAFQPYFSSREFASVEKLFLVPLVSEFKLVAVLLVTDLESPLASEQELMECLARAAEAGAPRVQEARAARSAGTEAVRAEAAPPRDDMSQLLAFLSGRSNVQLVALSLEDLSREILAAHEDLDPFRLHEDLQFFLGSFISDIGRALTVKPGRFTLALAEGTDLGLDLFAHQLTMFLDGLFGYGSRAAAAPGAEGEEATAGPGAGGNRPGAAYAKILKTASWPADGQDLRVLVESLSS
ncbi:MAG TPA: hypothetical protein VFI08_11955 [Spirochaetia bacterium]|nr:hypothetical protein [Spirochaetia bacterium]